MASTKLLAVCILLGLCVLASAQSRPNVDADVQSKKYAHGQKKESYKEKSYTKDAYDSKEYAEEPDEPYFKKSSKARAPPAEDDYTPPPPPTPSPYSHPSLGKYGPDSDDYKPAPPPASPKYPSPEDQYDSYHSYKPTPQNPKPYNPNYPGYAPKPYNPNHPGYAPKPYAPKPYDSTYEGDASYKYGQYGSKPKYSSGGPDYGYKHGPYQGDSPSIRPPAYYPDTDSSEGYGGYDGLHPKDVHFTLKETDPKLTPEPPASDTNPGSVSTRSANLQGVDNGMTMTVGHVGWTGITYSQSPVKINWQLSFVIHQDQWEGKLIAVGPASSQADSTKKEFPVVGGSGMYEGATGKVVWTSATGPAGIYTFQITLWPHKKRSYTPEYAAAMGMPDDMPDSSRR